MADAPSLLPAVSEPVSLPPARRPEVAQPVTELLARYLAPALLVLVAGSQLYLTEGLELLSPARGGGFGLFSTVDKLGDRQIRMEWIGPQGRARVALPGQPWILHRLKTAASLPSQAKLQGIAELMAGMGRAAEVEGAPPFTAARVEVWKRAFDQDTLQASRVKVAELVLEARP